MEFTLFSTRSSVFTLTTESAAASYGHPVLIESFNDWSRVLGPDDQIIEGLIGDPKWTAADLVSLWAHANGRTRDEKALAKAFIEQAPKDSEVLS